MKEIKKYTSATRYGKVNTKDVLNKGDYITITEKIDGANASFCIDIENELGVSCYSRNTPLNEESTLRGFYGWINKNIIPIKEKLNPNYRYFGEWLVSHKAVYKPANYQKFYMFSIWDEVENKYLPDEIVKSEAARLGLQTVPYFYEGEFISFEHLMTLVGKSNLTLEQNTGEGIVVKNVNYFDRYCKQMFVKLVTEKFAEVQKQRTPKNPKIDDGFRELVMTALTEARVEKIIHKLVDENLLKEDYAIEDMGQMLKLLGSSVFEDILKEESELFINYNDEDLKKMIGKNLPNVVKAILKQENRA